MIGPHILYLDRMLLRGSRTVAAVITLAYNAMRPSRLAAAAQKKPVPYGVRVRVGSGPQGYD